MNNALESFQTILGIRPTWMWEEVGRNKALPFPAILMTALCFHVVLQIHSR